MWVLAALLAQDAVVGREAELRVSGRIDFHYVYRSGELQETRNTLNGAPAPADSDDIVSGRASVRLEFDLGAVSGAVELANRKFDGGANLPIGGPWPRPFVREAYVDFDAAPLSIRAGVQPLRLTNRYEDEPFFLDLSESESAWLGLGPSGIRVTSDRDEQEPAGVRLIWDAAIFLKVQVFGFVVDEGGDEDVFGVYASVKPSDRLTVKVIATLFAGPAHDSAVGTAGAGVVWAPGEAWLLAAEAYGQFGDSASGLDKRAWAAQGSVRYAGEGWWAEIGAEYASGDDGGSDDEGWQSYENVNRFAIAQSAEFGLDWDTNYRAVRAAFEAAFDRVVLRLDAGWFDLDEDLAGIDADDIGFEIDAAASYSVTSQVVVTLRAAWLGGSDVLDAITGRESAWMGIAGFDLRY